MEPTGNISATFNGTSYTIEDCAWLTPVYISASVVMTAAGGIMCAMAVAFMFMLLMLPKNAKHSFAITTLFCIGASILAGGIVACFIHGIDRLVNGTCAILAEVGCPAPPIWFNFSSMVTVLCTFIVSGVCTLSACEIAHLKKRIKAKAHAQ